MVTKKDATGLTWQQVVLAIFLAAIAAIPPTIGAWAAYGKANDAAIKSAETHVLFNSRMSELLDVSKKAAADAAVLKEKQEQKERESAAVAAANAAKK